MYKLVCRAEWQAAIIVPTQGYFFRKKYADKTPITKTPKETPKTNKIELEI